MKNKKFIDAFNSYQVSEDLDKKILNYKDKKFIVKQNKFKFAFVFSLCLVILLVGTFSVVAILKPYSINKTSNNTESGFSFSLNEGVDFDTNSNIVCSNLTSVSDLENALNIDLLLDSYKINNCMINRNTDSGIESISLELENNLVINDVCFDIVNIFFMSKECSEETKNTFKNVIDFTNFSGTDEDIVTSIYSEKLKTDIYYVTIGGTNRGLPIFFVYDNVLYRFISSSSSIDEVIVALEKGL